MKRIFILFCLPLLLAGCSKDPVDDGDGDGAARYSSNEILFESSMVPITRSVLNEQEIDQARLYAWSDLAKAVTVKIPTSFFVDLPMTAYLDVLYYKVASLAFCPDCAIMTPNEVNRTLWDYDRRLSWNDYADQGLSFLAVCEQDQHVSFEGVNLPHMVSRYVPESEYDSINLDYYYRSGDLGDAMLAYAYNCRAEDYAGETKKNVILNFSHIFPRVYLNAKLDEENALDVEVAEAYLYGLQINGSHTVGPGNSFSEKWVCSNDVSQFHQFVQMDLKDPVKLSSEYKALVDDGREPHLLPQKIKPWSYFAAHDGAGIVMKVKIRNLHDNSWIVGNDQVYELVYAPFPLDEIKMGYSYDINLVFGAQYRSNGNAYGFKLSYSPMVEPWDVDGEDVELTK